VSEPCLFCKIIAKEIPTKLLYEDDQMLAFRDIHPLAPVHVLIVPKQHIPTVADLPPGDGTMGRLVDRANSLASELGIADKGYRLMVNCGPDGGQMVYHLHLHLLGGQKL
jgi:histidine triad (HIT) family protein